MRIIAGSLGGRNFVSPHSQRTHPMSDKMRGGLFSALGDIKDLTVLDVFSGSGALSYEAVSRGAKSSQAVDADKNATQIIIKNIHELGLSSSVKITRAYFSAWSNRNQASLYDLVLADPPYDALPYKDIKKLNKHLNDMGTLVLSWPTKIDNLSLEGLRIVHQKDYGDSKLVFYKKVK